MDTHRMRGERGRNISERTRFDHVPMIYMNAWPNKHIESELLTNEFNRITITKTGCKNTSIRIIHHRRWRVLCAVAGHQMVNCVFIIRPRSRICWFGFCPNICGMSHQPSAIAMPVRNVLRPGCSKVLGMNIARTAECLQDEWICVGD